MSQMPVFDEWGPRPAGLQGPRENLVVVVALAAARGDSSSSGGAGRHEPPEAEGALAKATTLGGAHEGAAPEAHVAAVEGGERPLAVPEAEAPEAPAALLGEATGSAHQADAPDASRLDASSSSQADPCAQLLGRFRVDFEALWKRREALGDDYPCRLLKRRNYYAIDE